MGNNWMELGLSKDEEEFVRLNAELYKKVYIQTIDTIFGWARAIEILRRAHSDRGIRGDFTDALVQYGFTARDGGPMNKAIRSHLKTLLENEQKVRAWWASVPERTKRDWLSAKAIYTHWKASLKPKDPNTRATQQERTTNIEPKTQPQEALAKASAKIAALEQELAQQLAKLQQLEAEAAALRQSTAPQAASPTRVQELEQQTQRLQSELQALRHSNAHERRQRLESENRHLKQELDARKREAPEQLQELERINNRLKRDNAGFKHDNEKLRREVQRLKTKAWDRASYNKVLKVLHPDHVQQLPPDIIKQYDEAFGIFTERMKSVDEKFGEKLYEKPPPPPPPMPTSAELYAARAQVSAERSARARKAAQTRKMRANSGEKTPPR
jgi:hypothetical protein